MLPPSLSPSSSLSAHVETDLNLGSYQPVPTLALLPLLLSKCHLTLGIVTPLTHQADVLTYLKEKYPPLGDTAATHHMAWENVVTFFTSSYEVDTYVRPPAVFSSSSSSSSSSHSTSHVPLYGALVLDFDNDRLHSATIRLNATSWVPDLPGGPDMDFMNAFSLSSHPHTSPDASLVYQKVDVLIPGEENGENGENGEETAPRIQTVRLPGLIPLAVFLEEFQRYSLSSQTLVTTPDKNATTYCHTLHRWLHDAQLNWKEVSLDSFKACLALPLETLQSYFAHTSVTYALQRLPIPSHDVPLAADPLQNTIIMYLLYPWVLPFSRFVRSVVLEKETHVREAILMLGVPLSVYLMAWGITYTVVMSIIATFAALLFQSSLFVFTSPWLIFVYLQTFALSLLAYALLLTTFFTTSHSATGAAPLLLMALSLPYLPYAQPTLATHFWVAALAKGVVFSSPATFCLGMETLFHYEKTPGMSLWAIPAGCHTSVLGALIGMGATIVLYLSLAALVSRASTTLEPMDWSYWLSLFSSHRGYTALTNTNDSLSLPNEEEITSTSSAAFEPLTRDHQSKVAHHKALLVSHLRKCFGTKVAVCDLSLAMVEGEIFGLLGQNGAGKTTTIGVLTGLLAPTEGSATVYGLPLDDMAGIRALIGVCPQHDVLMEHLTVSEHLQLVGQLKGVAANVIQKVVLESVQMLGLASKHASVGTTLSGGQKRKLSVGMALLGNSKVVFLDEPTSGMDPYSKRSMWTLLQAHKKGRVMILTTHSMDEADILCDRMAIMAEGTVRCSGSSMFLKAHYGIGYTLVGVKAHSFRAMAPIVTLLKAYVAPDAIRVLSNDTSEFSIRLTSASTDTFEGMFNALDAAKKELGIKSYGISITTLEDVFVAANEAASGASLVLETPLSLSLSKATETASESTFFNQPITTTDPECSDDWFSSTTSPSTMSFRVQVAWLCQKRFWLSCRNLKLLGMQFIIPLVFLTIMVNVSAALLHKNDETSLLHTQEWPSNSLFFIQRVSEVSTLPEGEGASLDYLSALPSFVSALVPEWIPRRDPTSPSDDVSTRTDMATYLASQEVLAMQSARGGMTMGGLLTTPWKERSVDAMSDLWTVFHNTTRSDVAINLLHSLHTTACGQDSSELTASDCDFDLRLHPLPDTQFVAATLHSLVGFLVSVSVTMTLVNLSASFAADIVKEREMGVKHLQALSGVSLTAYWSSHLLFDAATLLCVTLYIFGLLIVTGLLSTYTWGMHGLLALALGLYTASSIGLSYVLSHLFASHSSAQVYLGYLNSTQVLAMTLDYVLSNIPILCGTMAKIRPFLVLFPGFAMGNVMVQLATLDSAWWRLQCPTLEFNANSMMSLLEKFMDPNASSTSSNESVDPLTVVTMPLCALAGTSLMYFLLVMLVDSVSSHDALRRWWHRFTLRFHYKAATRAGYAALSAPSPPLEEDVAAQATAVDENSQQDVLLALSHVKKCYPGGKRAIEELTFGIPRGACFGFLGINGAGKSSTLKVLTGAVPASEGDATLYPATPSSATRPSSSLNVFTQQAAARRLMGYCPQENALFELLTVTEHLCLFAHLQGIQNVEAVVDKTMTAMDLRPFAHVYASHLSGGNKRKLQVGLALIGKPQLAFMDEPSTGVDPISRRALWQVFRQLTASSQSTLVLTTHSMEEATAVCTVASIMVSGQLACWGTIQQLKTKFSKGLLIEVTFHPMSSTQQDEVGDAVAQALNVPTLAATHPSQALWTSSECQLLKAAFPCLCAPDTCTLNITHGAWEETAGDAGRPRQSTLGGLSETWTVQATMEAIAQSQQEDRLLDNLIPVFPEVLVLERHGHYVKVEVPYSAEVPLALGSVFGHLARVKSILNIHEYNIFHPNLLQIFHQFAKAATSD